MDSLAPDRVEPLLTGRFGRPYRYLETCPSTQRELASGDPEGAVVAAGHQTAGRGRLGRVWEDEAGAALLFSLLLRPAVPPDRLPGLTIAAAEAVAEVLGGEVKEPNDVLLEGRKVAGILGEAREGAVVLGIGVNANGAPSHVPAISVREHRGEPVDRAELLAAILAELERRYDAWVSGST